MQKFRTCLISGDSARYRANQAAYASNV
jgi:hypothetical protein